MLKSFLIFCLVVQALALPAIAANSNNDRSRRSAANNYKSHYKARSQKKRRVVRVPSSQPESQPQIIAPAPVSQPQVSPTPIATVQVADLNAPERTEISRTENFGKDVQGGNVEVKLTSNGSATAKLGMAQRGVIVIEFPASDPVYKIFAGDENYIRVDCGAPEKSSDQKNDAQSTVVACQNLPGDSIVLYPGIHFNKWETSDDATTAVTVQRASGIVVSFIVVPVRSMANHTFHVAVRYDLDDVIAQRRAAGLPFNLANALNKTQPAPNVVPRVPTTTPGAIVSGEAVDAVVTQNQTPQFQNAVLNEGATQQSPAAEENDLQTTLETRTVAQLRNAAKTNNRLYFGKPFHGLSLAVVQSDTRVTDYSIDVVAVKNLTQKPIRLVPDQPEIFIESGAKDGVSVSNERLPLLYVATTAEADDVLLPNQVYYFAFAYKSPILGAKQRLSVGFAQREAADEPTTLALLGLAR